MPLSPTPGARNERNLAFALVDRDLSGQAKRILMERYHITGDLAFLLLTRTLLRVDCCRGRPVLRLGCQDS